MNPLFHIFAGTTCPIISHPNNGLATQFGLFLQLTCNSDYFFNPQPPGYTGLFINPSYRCEDNKWVSMNSEEAVLSGKLDCMSKFTDYSYLFIYLLLQQPLKKRIISRCGQTEKKKKETKNKPQNIKTSNWLISWKSSSIPKQCVQNHSNCWWVFPYTLARNRAGSTERVKTCGSLEFHWTIVLG